MRKVVLVVGVVSLVACGATDPRHGGGTGSNGNNGGGSGTGGGGSGSGGGPCNSTDPNADADGDGYTPAQGDCNDCDPNINPGAVDVMGDNDCDGMVDDHSVCDAALVGKTDAASIAQAMDVCDSRFLKNATFGTPANSMGVNDTRARNILASFGSNWTPHKGGNMAFISTGDAVPESGPGFVNPQDGTALGGLLMSDHAPNPLPNLKGASNCTSNPTPPTTVYDYTEIALELVAPTNANSFSFDFQFFSGEYPEFVCDTFNDQLLVIVKSDTTYPTDTNISFDSAMNPITVNSGFFSICDDYSNSNVINPMPCKQPASTNAGTGYETAGGHTVNNIPGGSTGWLSTTAPIAPREHFTLRFIIFDEGDDILDSSALIDNFHWGTTTVTGPTTGPIGYRIIKHHNSQPSLMCEAASAPA